MRSSDNELDLRQQISRLNALNEILGSILFPNTIYSDTHQWSIRYHASTGDGAVICFKSVIDPFELAMSMCCSNMITQFIFCFEL
jgi:hypothetical protein